LAAACGVVVLWPRNGAGPNPRHMWKELKEGLSKEEALDNMIRVKLDGLEADEKALGRRSGWAVAGFIVLLASVALSVVTAGIGVAQQPPPVGPTNSSGAER
jgi:hypothetical protein